MADNSIARELYSLVSPFNYCEHISCLDTDDFMTVRCFKKHELSQLFVIDCSKCIIQGEINNDHLFETFGHFSDESLESVRMDIIKCIESGKKVYENVGIEFFECRHWSLQEWAMAVCSQFYHGDELLIYALCTVFHHHADIVCYDRYWCMFAPSDDMNICAILDACDLHQVYIRPGVFNTLHPK